MANKSTIRFMRRKGQGGPWTMGFVHPGSPVVDFCTYSQSRSQFEFMPGRFGVEGSFKKFRELREKGMIEKETP